MHTGFQKSKNQINRIGDFFTSRVNIGGIVMVRIVFGLLMAIEMMRYLSIGYVHDFYSAGSLHFPYGYFQWVTPGEWVGMTWFFCFMGILGLTIGLGMFYRLSVFLFTVGILYIQLIDKANYNDAFYFYMSLSILLLFIPANIAFAHDERRRPIITSDSAPFWCVFILRLFLAIVFFYSVLAKLNSDWLSGEILGASSSQTLFPYRSLLAYGYLFLETFLLPAIYFQSTRYLGLFMLTIFVFFQVYFFNEGVYPWVLASFCLIYLPPRWPHFSRRLWPEIDEPRNAPVFKNSRSEFRKKFSTVASLCLFFAVQLIVPVFFSLKKLNGPIYRNPRFSWASHYKKYESDVQLYFRSNLALEETRIFPERYLNVRQIEKLGEWPDLVYDLSLILKKKLEEMGHRNPEIYVRLVLSSPSAPQIIVFDANDMVLNH